MQLRETTRRTLSIVACLPNTWKLLHSVATDTVADRFTETPILASIVDPQLGRAAGREVARRDATSESASHRRIPPGRWRRVRSSGDLEHPHPAPAAPAHPGARGGLPARGDPRAGLVRRGEPAEVPTAPVCAGSEPATSRSSTGVRGAAASGGDREAALNQHTEDAVMPDLLHGRVAVVDHRGRQRRPVLGDRAATGRQRLHAGLRRTLDEERDIASAGCSARSRRSHGNSVLRMVREAQEPRRESGPACATGTSCCSATGARAGPAR